MKFFNFLKKINIFKKLNFKNSITLSISGYNLERYLNILCSKNIEFLSVERINNKNATIEIRPIFENEVERFLKNKNIDITKKKYNGFISIQKFFFSRFGILIGLFLAFCFYIISSNYVLNFQVIGNQIHSSSEIISLLNEQGINFFDPLNLNSNEEIENIILNNFNEVSMVSVVKKGNTIIINIKEKIINKEHENVENYSPLLATNDGIITKIELIQGTPLVKVGDVVRAGDKLIAPYITDSSNQQIPIEPKANIYADIWLSGESLHYEIKNVVSRTGKQINERRITFLGKNIFNNDKIIPYNTYETETKEVFLSDSILPINYQTITYYETITKIIEQSFKDVEQEKIAEAKNLAEMLMKGGEEKKNENYIITSHCGKTTVNYSITVNRKIS